MTEEKMTERLRVHMAPTDKKIIENSAKMLNMTISDYTRMKLLTEDDLKKVKANQKIVKQLMLLEKTLKDFNKNINGIANNLNQITKKMNNGDTKYEEERKLIIPHINATYQLREKLRKDIDAIWQSQ